MANLKDLIVNGSARILGTLYAPDIKNTQRVTEFIVGTQTASTGSWTGKTEDTVLYDGKNIHYFLPYAGSGNASLNLTLAGGTTTGAKPIYLSGTSYVTTQYNANSCINMTYNATKGAWFVNADINTQDVTRLQWSNSIKAATAITANRVIVGDANGYKNIAVNATFDISYPILYSKSAINATATGTNNWQSEPAINLANNKSGWTGTNYSVVYLVGTLNGTTFTIDSTMLTTTVPTTEDGKIYTPLGVMYSTTNCYFRPTNQYYIYKNGSFQPYGSGGGSSSSRNIGEIVASTLPLTDAGLHLLDGSLIRGDGIYSDFVDYMAGLYEETPDANYFAQGYSETVYNYTAVGTVSNDDGILSGFSASNYIRIPTTLSSSSNVVLTTKVKITNFHSTYNDIFKPGTIDCPVGFNSAGKLGMYSTSSWLLGSTTYSTNTWIWVRLIWNGSNYKVYGLIDNGYTLDSLPPINSWTLEATWTTTTNIWTQVLYMGNSNKTTTEYLGGNIDLNETRIEVDNETAWSGTTKIEYTPEEVWQQSITTYGVCGKFVYDSTNNTVRLPKVTGIVEGTTDISALGDLVEAGLPNIKGTLNNNAGDECFYKNSATGTGAIYPLNAHTSHRGTNSNGADTTRGFGFDASRSSSIYGKSSTVQPQTIKVLYYIVVANSTKTDIEVDIDEIATDLNSKANVDLNNVSNTSGFRKLIEIYNNDASWYKVFNEYDPSTGNFVGKWCEQGGFSNTSKTINLLKTYTNTNYTISIATKGTGTGSGLPNALYWTKTVSSFYIDLDYVSSNRNAGGEWRTCGYII